jgi:hypothetical protein
MSDHDRADSPDATAISRRDLFLGAGMTAGAVAAIGGLAWAPSAQAALSKSRQYFATTVALELDGISAGRVASAEGGEPVIVPATPVAGVEKTATTTTLRYEPFVVRMGDMSPALYDWIGKSTIGAASPRGVNVITTDSVGKEIYRLAMQNVRLTEVQLDSLDAAKTDAARFTVKMAPGLSAHQFGGKGTASAISTQKTSPILRSNFRLFIQGLEAATTRARSVDAVGLQIAANGALVPMALRFSVAFADASLLFSWMQETLAGKGSLRQGELQLLTRDLTKVASSVSFSQLMITRISCPAEAASGSIQHAEVECVPTGVTFNMGALLT